MKKISHPAEDIRWWDLPAALILIAALLTAATRLATTQWTNELSIIQTITLLGSIAGLALGKSRFSPKVVRLFAFLYGAFVILWQIGSTVGEDLEWTERLLRIGLRLITIIDVLAKQRPVSDNLLFLLLMSIVFWSVSVYAGYSLVRYANPWRSILPTGFTLIIIQIYDPYFSIRTWFLAGYLFLALLLIARLNFLLKQDRWKRSGAYLPPYLGLDFIRTALIATALLILFAWTAPALASAFSPAEQVWKQVTSPWQAVKDNFRNAFSSLRASVGLVSDFYDDTLQLGRGNPLTDTVVFTVDAPARVAGGVRYYWRAWVYDQYDSGWTNTMPAIQAITPSGFGLNYPTFEARQSYSFTVTSNQAIKNLLTPPQPEWVDRSVQAHIAINPDATIDLGALQASPYIRAGDQYQVTASISSATITQLREANMDYPSWVTMRYLQLPENITPRTRQLAVEITRGIDNPYEKAEAITRFLRANLTYSDTIPAPPSNQEPIDWILFEHQQAFCNYYATAEVILLRSLGIPARLAVGYAEGERQIIEELEPAFGPVMPDTSQEYLANKYIYTVRHRDAHSWPEVFFPGYGWIEFEPTASQNMIIRPLGAKDEQLEPESSSANPLEEPLDNDYESLRGNLLAGEDEEFSGGFSQLINQIPVSVWAILGILSIALIVLLIYLVRRKRHSPPIPLQLESSLRRIGLKPPNMLQSWVRYATLSPLTKAYLEINRALSRLGMAPQPFDTPSERARVLTGLIPIAEGSIQFLIREYQTDQYSTGQGDVQNARQAGIVIRNQSFVAWFQRLFSRFQEPEDKRKARKY
jgi:transglutaminase-like putative cysteine protease